MYNIEQILKYTKKLKLLYVEDNQQARESTLIILNDIFKEVIIAEDGEDGLDKFHQTNPQIIITDVNMPYMDGLEMIQNIRKTNNDIPVIVISAYNESEYFLKSIAFGVDGYILKPLEFQHFFTILEKVIDKLIMKDELATKIRLLEQYEEATNYFSIVSKTDPNGILTYVNDDFCLLSGYTKEELIGNTHNLIRDPNTPKEFYEQLWDTIKNKKETWSGLIRNKTKDGKCYYAKTTIMPIFDIDDNIIEYIALRDDITDILNPQKQLYDFADSIENALGIMIRIDDFETLQKFYSHKIIEQFRTKFANILMEHLPEEIKFDKIFPLENGRYVLIKEYLQEDISIEQLTDMFMKYQEEIDKLKIDIANNINYDVTIIISIATGQNVLENINYGIDTLIQNKQNFIISNDLVEQEHSKAQQNIQIINIIKQALDDAKVVSYFQPIVNNKTKQIEKYESLVRLIDKNGNMLSPFFFLDIAKKGRLYSSITDVVLENSFGALKKTTKDITINISALDIEKTSTREKIFELLEQYKDDRSRIIMELLEDESVKDFDTIRYFIIKVKSQGVRIAIDDFGAGYSNFERLLDYQPDIIKIDGCLIKNILIDDFSLDVVETIVAFAKKQNIKTVAEFVENADIYTLLTKLGVDYSQGYYFGKPDTL